MTRASSKPPGKRTQVTDFTDRVQLAKLVYEAREHHDAGRLDEARKLIRQAEKLRDRAGIND